MSSPGKDARWELATQWADGLGLDFEDLTFVGWQKLLDEAQRWLDKNPGDVTYLATEWNNR